MVQDARQYGSTEPIRAKPTEFPNATSDFDKARLASYRLYEDLYLTNSADYKVVLRGGDNDQQRPIYVPNGEKIVEAKVRFLGKGLSWTIKDTTVTEDPEADPDAEEVVDPNVTFIEALLDRENWDQKFANLKRWMEIRGDQLLLITGDEAKEDGKRLSLHEIDPSTYYPYESPVEPGKILGVWLVDEYPKPGGKKGEMCARVQKYMRTFDETTYIVTPESGITYSSSLYETGKWDDRPNGGLETKDIKKQSGGGPEVEIETTLPDGISSLPVYHFRGHPLPNAVFGRSGLAGLESLITAVSQTMTDEDLIMVFGGLGFYATDAGPPRDPAGNIVPWQISPLKMVEHGKDDKVYRVNGVASLDPSQVHMQFAQAAMQETKGVPDIAVGIVDAGVAESGIALELKMGAILGAAQEQELELKSVLRQFFYNLLTQWLPAYESIGQDDPEGKLTIEIGFIDPKPVNQEKTFNQLMMLWDSGIISAEKLCARLSLLLGFELTVDDFKQATEDKKSMAIAADPFGAAMAAEGGVVPGEEVPPEEGPVVT
jgi:hypothetical protein